MNANVTVDTAELPPLRVFGAEETRRGLPFERLVPALRQGFAAGGEVPPRHHHHVSGSATTLLLMPAWSEGGQIGVKLVNVVPENAAAGLPAIQAAYLLADYATGRWLALLDGNEITARRTAAASALASSFLARADAASLLIVGAGRVAALLAEAHLTVRPIEHVKVWARNPRKAEMLATGLSDLGFSARATSDLESAVRTADIVSCATLSHEAIVRGAWLRPGTHVDLIGAFTPSMREVDDEAVLRSRVFVDTEQALVEAGDLCPLLADGRLVRAEIGGTLAELCTGIVPGRGSGDEITLFKSVGTALEDLVAAQLVYGCV